MKSSYLVRNIAKLKLINNIGHISHLDEPLCNRFNITKFPSIIILENIENDMIQEDLTTTLYKGSLKIDEITSFLNKFALPEKRYRTVNRSGILGKEESVRVDNYTMKYLNTTNHADWFVNKHAYDNVMIYFANNSTNKNNTNQQNVHTEIKKILKSVHGFYYQGYINCDDPESTRVCKEWYYLKSWPNLILYQPMSEKGIEDRVKSGVSLPVKSHQNLRQILFDRNKEIGRISNADDRNIYTLATMAFSKNKAALYHFYDDQVNYS